MTQIFRISPLIRLTLVLLYLALTVPLPFLATVAAVAIPTPLFWIAIALGGVGLWGLLSEQVEVTESAIGVTHPRWIRWLTRRAWSLPWSEIAQLKLRTTGQGGLVYYFVTAAEDRAYLLPMRVAGFAQLVRLVQQYTGIDTTAVRPLAQPWMYVLLLGVTLGLWLVDGWAIATALAQGAR